MRLPFFTLDVFTDAPFSGNPLAVVLDADALPAERMQAVAREFNLSETVFVQRPRDPVNTARLRIFTPRTEIPFAGHPTIGAAILIAQNRAPDMLGEQPFRIALELDAGLVVCEVAQKKPAAPRAIFALPRLPQFLGETGGFADIADALGLSSSDIGFDGHLPCLCSAGVPMAFIPVASLAAVARISPRPERFVDAFRLNQPAVFVYTRETHDPAHAVHARMFAPALGVPEDPATGAAAAAFAAVAARFERPEDGEHTIVIEQGFEMGRPSHIVLTLEISGGALASASIGGQAVRISDGFLQA